MIIPCVVQNVKINPLKNLFVERNLSLPHYKFRKHVIKHSENNSSAGFYYITVDSYFFEMIFVDFCTFFICETLSL